MGSNHSRFAQLGFGTLDGDCPAVMRGGDRRDESRGLLLRGSQNDDTNFRNTHKHLVTAIIRLLIAIVAFSYSTSVPSQAQSCQVIDSGCQGFCDPLVDVAANSALAHSLQQVPRPVLTFVTTANTVIDDGIVSNATQRGVEVRQMVAEEIDGWISLPTSKTLNPASPWRPTLHQLWTRACDLRRNPGPGDALPVDDPDFPTIWP